MRDIRDQLTAYAELLDQAAPPLDDLTSDAPRRSRLPRMRAGWAVAAGAVAVLVVVGGIAAVSRRTTATTVPPAESTSTVFTTPVPEVDVEMLNPQAVTPTTFSNWEHAFAGPGGVAVVDGSYHMLSAAYGGGLATVAYATSDDGVVWSQGSPDPVLDLADAPWAPIEFDHALPRSLVVDGDGVWQLFFEVAWVDDFFDKGFFTQIGRATADDPAGPWTFDEDPLLRSDPDVAWRSERVASPSVVVTDAGFTMLFVGYGEEVGAIGLAQSSDGASWEVRPGPVFAATDEWERDSLSRVDLMAIEGGYAMVYAGDTTSRRGIAVSRDTLEWSAHPENPILSTLDVPRASVFDSEFVVVPNGLQAYIENGGVRSEREVVVLQIGTDFTTMLVALLGES